MNSTCIIIIFKYYDYFHKITYKSYLGVSISSVKKCDISKRLFWKKFEREFFFNPLKKNIKKYAKYNIMIHHKIIEAYRSIEFKVFLDLLYLSKRFTDWFRFLKEQINSLKDLYPFRGKSTKKNVEHKEREKRENMLK